MGANPYLEDAIKVFKELGWEKATPETYLTMPLGTKEQQKIALKGLKSGDIAGTVIVLGRPAHKSYVNVDSDKLSIFAILVGVEARRAITLIYSLRQHDFIIDVLSTRSEKFAKDFIRIASAEFLKKEAVQLFYKYEFEVPEDVNYIYGWSYIMAIAMGLVPAKTVEDETLSYDVLVKRYLDHIRTGVAVNVDATNYFTDVFLKGYETGLISRKEALGLVFSALDTVVRPSDRKAWVEVIEQLKVTDDELKGKVENLIPVMATGDNIAISSLAPRLIKLATDDVLIELLMATLGVKTKKGKLLVLKAAMERPCPTNVENISDWLNVLAEDKDSSISSNAKKLLDKWSIEEVKSEVVTEVVAEIQGLWRPTPKLWEVPNFDLGEVSEEALTDILAEIINSQHYIYDVLFEKFLAMVCLVAYKDVEACKRALVGIKNNEIPILLPFTHFVIGGQTWYGRDITGFFKVNERLFDPLGARQYSISVKLGEIPCLLSTPSKIDLSINFNDFVNRVKLYAEKGVSVMEADLFVALTRIDTTTVNDDLLGVLKNLKVPIVLQSGKKMSVNVFTATKTYMDNIENIETATDDTSILEKCLPKFPSRGLYNKYSLFPNGDDFTLGNVYWEDGVYNEKGLVFRQVAKRGKALPEKASMNFMAAQRSSSVNAVEDAHLAVIEAWERGLLIPNVADTKYLCKNGNPPTHLVLLATALENIAREGILSVVWPILDDVVGMSLEEIKMLTGTAEICDVVLMFLPEVISAIEKGIAPSSAVELKNIRKLAEKGGMSKAVVTAKAIVTQLPSLEHLDVEVVEELKTVLPFEEVWKVNNKKPIIYDDNLTMTIEEYVVHKDTFFLFTLILPEIKDYKFQIVIENRLDIVSKGVLRCRRVSMDFVTPPPLQIWLSFTQGGKGDWVWLRYNKNSKKFEVNDTYKNQETPLSITLLTLLIGLLGQDVKYVGYNILPDINKKVDANEIDDNIVKIVMKRLFQYDLINPSRFVRILEKDNKYLYAYWPMLSESIRLASEILEETNKLSKWINRVLDVSIFHGQYLKEAVKRGYISIENGDFVGLDKIANANVKSTAIQKAKDLKGMLGI